jgi:hypothetical protein
MRSRLEEFALEVGQRIRPVRRTVIWGGRRGDRWVGSREDLLRAARLRREAERLRREAELARRLTPTLVALGRMGKALEEAIADANAALVAWGRRFSDEVERAGRADVTIRGNAGPAIKRLQASQRALEHLRTTPGRRGR